MRVLWQKQRAAAAVNGPGPVVIAVDAETSIWDDEGLCALRSYAIGTFVRLKVTMVIPPLAENQFLPRSVTHASLL